ncbi:MAG TPA: HlyD family efflux transporter periplasmic adaptor subunit, partial [Stenomitos sp.]
LETAQQQLQTARARLVTNTQFSEAQEQERTIDSAKVPLVQNSGIAAQQAQIDALQSQRSLAIKELTRYQFLVNQGAAPRSEIDQRQSEVDQLNQRIRQAQETLAQLINSRDRELANVKAQINTARINTARIQAENDVASAKQAIELAQVKLDNTIIRSPVSGRILRIVTKAGESIGDQGQGKGTLVEVADTSAMQVVAEVSESDIRLVKPGQIAKIVSRNKAFEGTLTGRVTELGRQIFKNNVLNDDPSAFSDARVIQVKVAIDDSEAVAKFTNLQVDVQIEVQSPQPSPPS